MILQSSEEKFAKIREFNEKLTESFKKAEAENSELSDEVHRLELLLREKEGLILSYVSKIEELQTSAEISQSEYGHETARLQVIKAKIT